MGASDHQGVNGMVAMIGAVFLARIAKDMVQLPIFAQMGGDFAVDGLSCSIAWRAA